MISSVDLFHEAKRYIPGGVDSPVRAFTSTGLDPLFVKRANGKYIYSEEGRAYLDFCLSWGAIILGHNNSIIRRALKKAINNGTSYGMPTIYETNLAKLIIKHFPSIEKIRFVSSGTEAVMSAIRVARGFTKRNKIIKFDGCYHGHSDSILVKAGSGVSTITEASSHGIPPDIVKHTISIPYNNREIFEKTVKKHHKDIACVIIEPVPCNMGVILPEEGYLEYIRKITEEQDILLIFDEVISGFRIGLGGAQDFFKIRPDITTLGKIIGGGLPVGAFGGRAEILDCLAPDGDVYQAGTLSGNPLAMHAGCAAITFLQNHPGIYSDMEEKINAFVHEFRKKSRLTLNHLSTVFSIFYTENPVKDFTDAAKQESTLFKSYYKKIISKNILLPPSMFETSFLSIHHDTSDLSTLLKGFLEG